MLGNRRVGGCCARGELVAVGQEASWRSLGKRRDDASCVDFVFPNGVEMDDFLASRKLNTL